MSIFRVNKDDIENFTIVTTPRRSYTSSSLGLTGSIKLFPRLSYSEKDVNNDFLSAYGDALKICKSERAVSGSGVITLPLGSYIGAANTLSSKTDYKVEIERFSPSINITKYTGAKNLIKDTLMKYYRADYPHAHWAYTNYHSLNFFTVDKNSQTVPTSSVLLYPNVVDSDLPAQPGHHEGIYCLSGAFSFDFHVNMRYQTDGIDTGHFKAGTLLHLSSSYALSIVTGSSKDAYGLPDGFRLMLQLSQSADIAPSTAVFGSNPSNLIFLSDDNSLKHNHWHHAVVRWGTNTYNQGSGSFVVDGNNAGYFVVPSGTINPTTAKNKPYALAVGNYYEGTNTDASKQDRFFATSAAEAFGTAQLKDDVDIYEPNSFKFSHPLKAEIHNLSIKRYYVSDNEIRVSGTVGHGLSVQDKTRYAFHLPPMFTQASPIRKKKTVGSTDIGGVYQTPYKTTSATTDDPFNVAMAFIVNGHYINLENFTRDFTNIVYPRTINLSGSILSNPAEGTIIDANKIIYGMGGVPKRNLTILPCDDGSFDPNYELLKPEQYNNKYVNSVQVYDGIKNKIFKTRDWSYISLDNLVSTGSLKLDVSSSIYVQNLSSLYGPSPNEVDQPPGLALVEFYNKLEANVDSEDADFDRGILDSQPLPVFNQLREPSSNQITIFDVSNLFYGKRILPQSFVLTDSKMSGSGGSVKITLKDDGQGNLYRADSLTPHATQNSVGNIFYDEGLVLIKSPHLFLFGKDQYELSFKGINNIYTTKYEILANSGHLNSSSNISYGLNKSEMKPTGDITDKEGFIYVSKINLHDENMNVLARVKFAQPVIKRFSDKILFKFTIDS